MEQLRTRKLLLAVVMTQEQALANVEKEEKLEGWWDMVLVVV
jgi:hypothetical protein